MQTDKEMVILQSSNFSVFDILKPIIIFSIIMSLISFFFTLHQSPKSNQDFKVLLYTLKNDYSSTLLQEGTFNTFGKDFTIFVKQRKKMVFIMFLFTIHVTRRGLQHLLQKRKFNFN